MKKKLPVNKVTLVTLGLHYGGAEGVFNFLANALAQNGYDVTVLFVGRCINNNYIFNKNIKIETIESNMSDKLLKKISVNYQIFRRLCRIKDNVVISFKTAEIFFYGVIFGKKVIYTLRNDIKEERITSKLIRNILYSLSNRVVFQTPGFTKYFSKMIVNKSVIIPNPVKNDLPLWNKDLHNKVVITASRLEKQKNIPLLIDAFKKFSFSHPDFILEICGTGTLENELKEYVKILGMEKSINFAGHVTDLHERMKKSTMFVLSSDYEGLSNAMLESLAMGVPTICTDSRPGGAAQYIKNGENGFLVEVGNTDKLSDCMCRLADDLELCKKFSLNSQTIQQSLSSDVIYKKWEKIIKGE